MNTHTAIDQRPAIGWRVVMVLLAAAGLGLSVVLFVESMGLIDQPPGCGEGSGCETVLNSQWSSWLGVPVSGAAVVVYLAMLVASLVICIRGGGRGANTAWVVLVTGGVAAGGAAIWFMIVQWFFIGSLCILCTSVHSSGLLLMVLVCIFAPIRGAFGASGVVRLSPGAAAGCATAGLAAIAILIGGQLFFQPTSDHKGYAADEALRSTDDTVPNERLADSDEVGSASVNTATNAAPQPRTGSEVKLLDGKITIDIDDIPVVGSKTAPVIILSLFDYTCPHCQKMHWVISKMRKRYGPQLAFAVAPVPLNAKCNKNITKTHPMHRDACDLASIALRVWRAKPESFEEFDDFLFADPKPPSVNIAEIYAAAIVGKKAFEATQADAWVAQRIDGNTSIHKMLRKRSVPALITRSRVLYKANEPEQLFKQLEKTYDIKAVDGND